MFINIIISKCINVYIFKVIIKFNLNSIVNITNSKLNCQCSSTWNRSYPFPAKWQDLASIPHTFCEKYNAEKHY